MTTITYELRGVPTTVYVVSPVLATSRGDSVNLPAGACNVVLRYTQADGMELIHCMPGGFGNGGTSVCAIHDTSTGECHRFWVTIAPELPAVRRCLCGSALADDGYACTACVDGLYA